MQLSATCASEGCAGVPSGIESGPVQINNGIDTLSWHFMPLKNTYHMTAYVSARLVGTECACNN